MAEVSKQAPEAELVWDANSTDTQDSPPKALRFCQNCRNIMASPQNLRRLLDDSSIIAGIPICSGPDSASVCSFRAIAVACIDAKNRELLAYEGTRFFNSSVNLADRDPPEGTVVLSARYMSKGPRIDWYDFDTLELKYVQKEYCQKGRYGYSPLLNLEAFVSPGDPAHEYISARPPLLDLTSEETFDQIKQWMNSCERTHSACPAPEKFPLPNRVLDVGTEGGSETVRLCITNGAKGRYAALSYCWGGAQVLALTRDNLEQMQARIVLSNLPHTLQDAVFITRRLGLRYLWVDALCIVQDSTEDKEKEIKSMGQIFKQSLLTIFAASASSVRDGFLQTRKLRSSKYPRFTLPYRAWDSGSSTGNVTLQEQLFYDAFSEPINRRGWTLQERLLSPRVLIYGTHELIWECQTEHLFNGGSLRISSEGSERLGDAFFIPGQSLSPKNFQVSWEEILIDYTHRKVSFAEDKLIALAGLASEFQRLSRGDVYLAGLWGRSLLAGLMWGVHSCTGVDQRPQPRRSTYVAPSWSWASVEGFICFSGSDHSPKGEPYATILSCETKLYDDQLLTGRVIGGLLRIQGTVRKAKLDGEIIYDGTDAQASPIGKAYMDSDEQTGPIVFCLRMCTESGLILSPGSSPSIFRRSGKFEIWSPIEKKRNYEVCDDWFDGLPSQAITIE